MWTEVSPETEQINILAFAPLQGDLLTNKKQICSITTNAMLLESSWTHTETGMRCTLWHETGRK